MDLPDSALDGIAEFLSRRFVQLSFSIPTAFLDILAEPVTDTAAVTDHEHSPDSATSEFMSGEDHIISSLVAFRARATTRNPKMCIRIIRHRSQVHLTAFSHSFARVVSLAAVSRDWFQAFANVVSGERCLITDDLERASREWELPYRVLRSTQDEYIGRFTGRVVRNLQWGRVVIPQIDDRPGPGPDN